MRVLLCELSGKAVLGRHLGKVLKEATVQVMPIPGGKGVEAASDALGIDVCSLCLGISKGPVSLERIA